MRRRYTVILEPEEEGGYHASCPLLPGCHSEGESIEEALHNVHEAVGLYVESLVAHGEPVPEEAGLLILTAEVESDALAVVGLA